MTRILPDTHPLLRVTSAPVTVFDEHLTDLAADMLGVMRASDGCGLAAVQIGLPVNLIIAEAAGELLIMANPTITRKLRRDAVEREGCLSVAPMYWRKIARPAKCDVEWQDLSGERHQRGFSGGLARTIQHEIDHLHGVLITDYAAA